MTINLFQVHEALKGEDQSYIEQKQARERALRARGKPEDATESSDSVPESGSPEGVQTASE